MQIARSGLARTFAACLAALAVFAPVDASSEEQTASVEALATAWRSRSEHPLIGKVLDAKAASAPAVVIELSELPRRLVAGTGQIVLIGEQHDNDDHHRLQAALVEGLAPPTAAVFEQFDARQQKGLDAFAALRQHNSAKADLDELKRATDWSKSGWAKYNYDPLLRAVIAARLPIYAGDVPRETIRKVAKEGQGGLAAGEISQLKLDVALGAKLDAASEGEIEDSHCGMMPKAALPGMAFAQRYRDAHLAGVALEAAAKLGMAIVFAGNGHVRADRGVPWYLRQRAPDRPIMSVMLAEVEDGKNDPADYLARDPDGKPAADYVVFSPRVARDDPCVQFRPGKTP